MKSVARTLALSAVFGMAVACGGSEGPEGPPGATPELTFETVEPGEECPAGGTAVYSDGKLAATICDGVAGPQGPGPAGPEGPAGEPGATPEVEVERFDDHEDCGAGGVSITVSVDGEELTQEVICDGVDGEDGQDGEDGFSPIIDVTYLEPNPDGPCVDGGLAIVITTAEGSTTNYVCGADVPLPPPEAEIGSCSLQAPFEVLATSGDDADFFAQVYVPGYTNMSQPLPDSFTAQVGLGEPGDDGFDDDWTWFDGAASGMEGNNARFKATVENLDKGAYDYLFRMRGDDDADWVYCGVEGIIDVDDYDADQEAGALTVFELAAGWDFEGEDLSASTGTGEATFHRGVDEDGDDLREEIFYGARGSDQWGGNDWLEDDTFFDGDGEIIRDRYFRYETDFDGFDSLALDIEVQTSGTGPDRIQVAAEYQDGSVQFLADPVIFDRGTTRILDLITLPFFNADSEKPVAYRIYPYNSTHENGTFRMHYANFIGL